MWNRGLNSDMTEKHSFISVALLLELHVFPTEQSANSAFISNAFFKVNISQSSVFNTEKMSTQHR